MLPVSVDYVSSTESTSGQSVDSTRDRNEVYFRAGHTSKHSNTSLELHELRNTYTPTQGAITFDNRYDGTFQNQVFWTSNERSRNFNTSAHYAETSGINFAKYFDLTETVTWDLGRALQSGGSYSLSTVAGDPGSQVHNSGDVWLQHLLFRNLTTRLTVRGRKDEYPAGDDQEVAGGASVVYAKQFGDNAVTFGANDIYSVEKRNLGTNMLHVFNEQHKVIFGVDIFLAQLNAVVSSIVITNANPINHIGPYILNVDYQVVVIGAQTQIVPLVGGAIVVGQDTLLITYDYMVDPHLRIVTNTYGVSGAIQLHGGAYRVYGDYTDSDQDRQSGQTSLAGTTIQSQSHLGFERKWDLVKLTAEYSSFDSDADKHQNVQLHGVYSNSTRDWNLTLTASETYQWYDSVNVNGTTVQRSNENYITATANLNRRLSSYTTMALVASYLNVMGAADSDSFTIASSLRWAIGKLAVTFDTSAGIRRNQSLTSFSEHVFLRITRFF
jgi:hypothetical protein